MTNRPTAKTFKDPVVSAIAELTDFQSDTGVSSQTVIDKALRLAGYNPADCPHALTGRNGLYRIIGFAFRNQRKKYCGKQAPKTVLMENGDWALTPAGIIHAQSLTKPTAKKTGPTKTHQFIESSLPETLDQMRNDKSGLFRTMLRSVDNGMELTRIAGESEDMVQEYFRIALENDSFENRIQQGNPPSFSTVGNWATRKGITELRRRGQDAHCKSMFGCLTDKERKDRKEDEARRQREGMTLVTQTYSDTNVVFGSGEDGRAEILDRVDVSGRSNPDSGFNLESVWEDIEEALKSKFPHGYQRRLDIATGMYIDGDDVRDTAKKEGVSEHRAATLRSEVQVTIRKHLQPLYRPGKKG